MKNLQDLFEHMIKDLYSAEDQMLEAYKEMAAQADDQKLKEYFEDHYKKTEEHKEKLQEIADKMNIKPTGEKCNGMEGLVKEALGFLKEHELQKDVRDAGMIAQAQRIEHYEITGYGTIRRFAQELGHTEVEKIFQSILDDEYSQDDQLTELAEKRLNKEAK